MNTVKMLVPQKALPVPPALPTLNSLRKDSVAPDERHVQKRSGTSRLKKFTVHLESPEFWTAVPINSLVPADPCPSCVEARWMSRVVDAPETPLDEEGVRSAINELASDPAFVRSDRIHLLTECRVPRSRMILARRYMQN